MARTGWTLTDSGPALAVLALLLAARVAVAAATDFAPDEAYYWLWAQHPALSYYDHPPMVAWWIAAGTLLFGHSVWAVRSMALLGSVAGSALLFLLGVTLFGDRRTALAAVLWTNAMPLVAVGAVIITPDTPALLFWTLGTLALALVQRTGRGGWWYLFGAAMGALLLSKYIGFFLGAGAGLWLLLSPDMRPWLRRREPWAAAVLALVLFLPAVVWNAQHGWVSFAKQFGRVGAGSEAGLRYLWEFLGGQAGLVSPLIFLFAVAGLGIATWRGLAGRRPEWLLLALTAAPMLLFFVHHALADRVQANWPGAAYPAAILAAVAAFGGSTWPPLRRALRAAPWVGLVLSAAVYVQAATGLVPASQRIDPTARLAGWRGLAAAVEAAARGAGARYIVTSDYGLTGILRFYLPPDSVVFQANQSVRYSNEPLVDAARLASGPALYIASDRKDQADAVKPAFDAVTPLGTVPRLRAGREVEGFRLYRLEGYRGGLLD